MTVDTQVQVGSDFLGYRIEELIGRGGMGVVYRAYDLRLKRTVALKLVAPDLALDARFRARFARETELAMSLEHPNVVPVHDAGDVDDRLYLAMRFVEGTDLRALLRAEGPLEPARALAICRQVASALDAAHARGLVHRDVKPSNVLLDADEHAYLADFGLSRLVADGSPPIDGRSLGTPAYFAPEQLDGEPVDGRADLYSLACLLYECLGGEPPFPHASRLAVAWAHLEQEPPSASARNAALPAAVDAPLRQGLAKDPTDRPPTCAALIDATEAALGLGAPRRSRRRTALIAIGAAVLAGLAAVVTALVSGADDGATEPVLYGRPGTVIRIDPERNAVADVVPVGTDPEAVAARGRRVWVYDYSDDTISSVDERTKQVQSTEVLADPVDVSAYGGPVLAADTGGAWFIGVNDADRPVLVRITGTGRRRTFYPLDRVPWGVAVGYGAVWVVAHGERDSQLLRIDPVTGKITHRTRFAGASAIDSVAVGLGSVWVVGASSSTLYRMDARTGERRGHVRVAESVRAPRPYLMRGFVWVGLMVFDPKTLATVTELDCCPADAGEDTGGFGSVWTSDAPSGSVVRWGTDWEVEQTVRVVAAVPAFGGGCLTSIAAGAGGIWVTVASSFNNACGA